MPEQMTSLTLALRKFVFPDKSKAAEIVAEIGRLTESDKEWFKDRLVKEGYCTFPV